MRVLVTGGGGFIGSHLVGMLLERGDQVRVLDNFSTGRQDNLAAWKNDVEIVDGDLRDGDLIRRVVEGMEWIFHLAAFISVPESIKNPITCHDVNVNGTVNVLEAARQAGAAKVVFSSSTAVYGDTNAFPTSEETPPKPISPYALSKQVIEQYARLYTLIYGLPVVSLRYFNVYGPRQRPDSPYAAAIPIFLHRLVSGQPIIIFGDGRQSRDFIHVKDVAKANLLAASSGVEGDIFNICSGGDTNLLDLLEELSEVSNQTPEVRFEDSRPGDIYRSQGDPSKAERMLGFRARICLRDGLVDTLGWMEKEYGKAARGG